MQDKAKYGLETGAGTVQEGRPPVWAGSHEPSKNSGKLSSWNRASGMHKCSQGDFHRRA